MKKTFLAVVAATSLLAMTACSSGSDKPVATTSAGDISEQQLYDAMKDYLGESMLYQMIVEKVLSKEYKVTDKEIEAEIQKLKDQYGDQFPLMLQSMGKTEETLKDEVKFIKLREKAARDSIKVSEADIKAQYEKEKPEIRASHILVKTKDEANDIYKKIQNGEDFEKLAKKYSQDGSASKGGDLGYFGTGDMVPAFENAAYALKVNEVSKPVKSDYGYHIIKLTDKKEKESYDKMKDSIKEELIQEKLTADAINKAVNAKIEKANIKIKDKDLKDTLKNAKKAQESANTQQ